MAETPSTLEPDTVTTRRWLAIVAAALVVVAAMTLANRAASRAADRRAASVARALHAKLATLTPEQALTSVTQTGSYRTFAVGGDMVSAGLAKGGGVAFYNDPVPRWAFWQSRCVVGVVDRQAGVSVTIRKKRCP